MPSHTGEEWHVYHTPHSLSGCYPAALAAQFALSAALPPGSRSSMARGADLGGLAAAIHESHPCKTGHEEDPGDEDDASDARESEQDRPDQHRESETSCNFSTEDEKNKQCQEHR